MSGPSNPSSRRPLTSKAVATSALPSSRPEAANPEESVLVDVRPIAAYNGWPLLGERRSGHIPGARSFPLQWTEQEFWPDLLTAKEITPDRDVVVYGYRSEDTDRMAALLVDQGFRDVSVYNGFLDEWVPDDDFPLEQLPRYRQLVYPEWVHKLINGEDLTEGPVDSYVIGHATYDYREDYDAGHIPGAIHVNTLDLESPETWNRRSPDELRDALRMLGIRHDTTVILYGRFSHPNSDDPYPGRGAGHLAAIRCAVILMYAGVEDVRVLNGGFAAWRESGFAISEQDEPGRATEDFGGDIPRHPEYFVDLPEARELLHSPNGALVSVRSWREFIGEVSGYNYINRSGRIPGSIFGNSGSDAYHMENYRNFDHTMREYHEIAARWAASGIVPEKHIAFYCGTGWRASEAFLHAYLMGWPRNSVYDGGWYEWSSDPNNPLETGVPR